MRKDLSTVDLIIFGDFGVLTGAPFIDGKPLHMLPGRVEYLAHLREERARRGLPELKYAVMGNKGGVAYAIQSEEEAAAEVEWTAQQIGAVAWRVCFAHPTPKPGLERYAEPALLADRKPQPGMIYELLRKLNVPKERVLVVGSYADDCRAAKAAGMAYEVTGIFFARADQAEARAFVARVEQVAAAAQASLQSDVELGPVEENFDLIVDGGEQ